MADGIVNCKVLTGETRRGVLEELGPPDLGRRTRTWAYRIGTPRGDSGQNYLEVTFDGQGRVARTGTVGGG
jgi:hypothetical protein